MTGVIAALDSISKPITAQDICTMQNERLNSATIGKYGDCMETKGTMVEWQLMNCTSSPFEAHLSKRQRRSA